MYDDQQLFGKFSVDDLAPNVSDRDVHLLDTRGAGRRNDHTFIAKRGKPLSLLASKADHLNALPASRHYGFNDVW